MTQEAQTTSTTAQATTMHVPSRAAIAGIILMAAGWGWTGGNFVPSDLPLQAGIVNEALHFIPDFLLVLLGVRYFRAAALGVRSRGAALGFSILAVLSIIGCIVMVVLGATNPDPNSVGVHNLNDWVPVIIVNAGNLLWLGSAVAARRRA
jgi:hypothetical protein